MTKTIIAWLMVGGLMYSQAQQSGTVSGMVLDESGQAVPGAIAVLEDTKYQGLKPLIRVVQVDGSGRFAFDRVEWGSYSLDAKKESDGYPETGSLFYRDEFPNEFVLSPVLPAVSLTVRLGPKAGAISKMIVTDAVSGQPVESATVKLWRTIRKADGSSRETSLLTSTTVENLLVLPRTPITVLISAPGYSDWYYPGVADRSQSTPVFLQPGDKVAISVSLQALPTKP